MRKILPSSLLLLLCIIQLFLISCSFNSENRIDVNKNRNKIVKTTNNLLYANSQQQNTSNKKNIQQASKDVSDSIYAQKDISAAVPTLNNKGFIDLVKNNFQYPKSIKPVNGTISVDLVVEKDGSISNVIIIDGLHEDLNKEAVRVLKLMPKFIPGKKNGQPVRSKLRMDVFCVAS